MSNNDTVTKRGQPGCNLTLENDKIFKIIIHNINYISEQADLGATIDKTSLVTASFGEKDAGVA